MKAIPAVADVQRNPALALLAATAMAIVLVFIVPIVLSWALHPSSRHSQLGAAVQAVEAPTPQDIGKQPLPQPQPPPPELFNDLRPTATE